MAAFARCANPKCGIVLNLDRFPEGTPCHKCGERRRVPLPEVEHPAQPPKVARRGRRIVAGILLVALVGAVAGIFAYLAFDNAPTEPTPPDAAPQAPPPPPEQVPAPQSPPEPELAPATAPPIQREERTITAQPRAYTTFDLAIGEDEFMYRVNPGGGGTDIQRYEGADIRLDPATHAMALVYDKPYEKYKGAVYHWKGRKEILLPANDQIETALVCDVAGGKIHSVPADALQQKVGLYEVDMKAMQPLPDASSRVLLSLDVGFYHLLYILITLPEDETPLLAGYGYTGQKLPVRPARD